MNSSEAAAAMRSRSKRIPPSISLRHAQAELERVDRVEQRLLVLLEVLVVGERQPVEHAVQRRRAATTTRGALARSSSAASGFFFCGMRLEPEREGVGHLAEAELLARPEHDLAAELRQVGGAGGGGAEVVEHEVAVRHRVERVLGDAAEAELLGHEHAAGVEVHPGQRARAERQVVGGGHAEVEALEVAAELPEVGQQVVREVDRLGALEVGVAGQRPVEVALGELGRACPSARSSSSSAVEAVRAHEHRHVGGHLVVARAGGVQLAADRARRSR